MKLRNIALLGVLVGSLLYVTGTAVGGGAMSSGSGGLATDLICTQCVSGTELAANAVSSTAKIATSAVENNDIKDKAISASKMGDEDHGAISWLNGVATVEDLACTGCVDDTDLATDSVDVQEIATDAVRADEIVAGGVRNSEIYDLVCLHPLESTSTNPTEANGTPDFLSLSDRSGSQTENNEDDYIIFSAQSMSVNNLRCVTATAPGAGNDKWVMTVRIGTPGALSDKTVTCEIDETNVDCTNVSNWDAVASGEAITIGIESVGGVSPPTNSALITCAVCLGTKGAPHHRPLLVRGAKTGQGPARRRPGDTD